MAVASRASGSDGRELRARGQRTVRKLLDAGIEVFADKGYHASRVDDIVQVAKTSHGTFYLYFSNKEDLFGALCRGVSEEMQALIESLDAITPDAEGFQMLRGWVSDFTDIHRRYSPVIKAWTEAEIDSSELGRLGTGVLGEVTNTFARRIGAIKGTGLDAPVAAIAFVAMIERFGYYAITGQVRADDDTQIDTLTEVMFAALFGGAVPH